MIDIKRVEADPAAFDKAMKSRGLTDYEHNSEALKKLNVTSYVMNLENLPNDFEIIRFTDDKKFAVIEEREDFKRLVKVEMLQEMLRNKELIKS